MSTVIEKRYPRKGHKPTPEQIAAMVAGKRAKHPPRPLAERYWEKVDKRGPDECWNWLANKNPHGYGQIYPGPGHGKPNKGTTVLAHHVALQLAGIEVPPGMARDHICKNRACQNPAHIRVVPPTINWTENSDSPHAVNSRKANCIHGHPLSGANLAIVPTSRRNKNKPSRACLTCFPQFWMWAAEPREGPPGSRIKWRGPFTGSKP